MCDLGMPCGRPECPNYGWQTPPAPPRFVPATLEQIGQLGGPEKEAAREFAHQDAAIHPEEYGADDMETIERWAFLQGIHWERQRAKLTQEAK